MITEEFKAQMILDETKILLFPLSNAIILPRRELDLCIEKPELISLVDAALKSNRLLGIIQPKKTKGLHKIGCLARIIGFQETEAGYEIKLAGVCRFVLGEIVSHETCHYRYHVNYDLHKEEDLRNEVKGQIDRKDFLINLKSYLIQQDLLCDKWDEIHQITDDKMVSCLSMVCPFCPQEKQALLEAPDLQTRFELLNAFVERNIDKKCCCH